MDRRMFQLARDVSLTSLVKCARVGAVITIKHPEDGERVIAAACNEYHNGVTPPYSIHAEVAAYLEAVELGNLGSIGYNRDAASMYVYRETKSGRIADSKPCEWCEKFLSERGINTVHYTSSHGPFYRSLDFS